MKNAIINYKHFLTLLFIIISVLSFSQDAAAPAAATDHRAMYEKFGMTELELFTLMLSITILLVAVVFVMAGTAKNALKYKYDHMNSNPKTLLVLVGIIGSISASASTNETSAIVSRKVITFSDSAFWSFVILDILLLCLIFYFRNIINLTFAEFVTPKKSRLLRRWEKQLGDAVPIEQESSILLDHDYDGIKELDNNLPPWWKYGFYVTIVWSIFYLFYYQILEIGPLQMTEFNTEMEEGDRADAAYIEAHPELITADNVTQLEDQATLSKGQDVYIMYCQTCHMEKGKGGTGPNLTDKNWLYGGDIKSLFNTISNGTKNGMTAWKELIPGNEIQAVASYILKLEYVAPPNGKQPEGSIIVD